VRRTFRDKRETAFEAARYAKSKAKGDELGPRRAFYAPIGNGH
jgi:hypothetical protein